MGIVETDIRDGVAIITWKSNELMGGPEIIELKDSVREVLDQGVKNIVVDLSKLENSNSTGLGSLLYSWNMSFKEGAQLVVVLASSRVIQLFNVTKLNTIMTSFGSVDDAVSHFSE